MKAPSWVIWVALVAVLVAMILVGRYAIHHRYDEGILTDLRTGCYRVWSRDALPLPVFIEHGSASRTKDVQEAIEFWNKKTGIEFFRFASEVPMLRDDMPVTIQEDTRFNGHGEAQAYFDGHCVQTHAEVRLLASPKSDDEKRHESIHELGHVIGLGHDDTELRAMHPELRWTGDDVSEDDVLEIRKVYAD